MNILLGILIGVLVTTLFTQSYRRTLIISHVITYTGVSTCVEEVGLEVVRPNIKGILDDPNLQNRLASLIVMMIAIEAIKVRL